MFHAAAAAFVGPARNAMRGSGRGGDVDIADLEVDVAHAVKERSPVASARDRTRQALHRGGRYVSNESAFIVGPVEVAVLASRSETSSGHPHARRRGSQHLFHSV